MKREIFVMLICMHSFTAAAQVRVTGPIEEYNVSNQTRKRGQEDPYLGGDQTNLMHRFGWPASEEWSDDGNETIIFIEKSTERSVTDGKTHRYIFTLDRSGRVTAWKEQRYPEAKTKATR